MGDNTKTTKLYTVLLIALIVSCTLKEVSKNNIKVHFKSLANDFAAVDMSLYGNNKFELKTATLEMHGNKEYITEIEGSWTTADSNYTLIIENIKKEELIEYFFNGWEHEESGFERIGKNKVSFPIDKDFLIINNVMCQKQ
jgi:hypothetical protein